MKRPMCVNVEGRSRRRTDGRLNGHIKIYTNEVHFNGGEESNILVVSFQQAQQSVVRPSVRLSVKISQKSSKWITMKCSGHVDIGSRMI